MARAKTNQWGDAVLLKLSFSEAAALHALLARVGPETDELIHDATFETFITLDNLRGELEDETQWPDVFDTFASREQALLEPGDCINAYDDAPLFDPADDED